MDLELFRLSILRVLEANNTRRGLGAEATGHLVARFGFKPTMDQVRTELQYLTDKELVAPVEKTLNPENALYRITAKGRDFLASEV